MVKGLGLSYTLLVGFSILRFFLQCRWIRILHNKRETVITEKETKERETQSGKHFQIKHVISIIEILDVQ